MNKGEEKRKKREIASEGIYLPSLSQSYTSTLTVLVGSEIMEKR